MVVSRNGFVVESNTDRDIRYHDGRQESGCSLEPVTVELLLLRIGLVSCHHVTLFGSVLSVSTQVGLDKRCTSAIVDTQSPAGVMPGNSASGPALARELGCKAVYLRLDNGFEGDGKGRVFSDRRRWPRKGVFSFCG